MADMTTGEQHSYTEGYDEGYQKGRSARLGAEWSGILGGFRFVLWSVTLWAAILAVVAGFPLTIFVIRWAWGLVL